MLRGLAYTGFLTLAAARNRLFCLGEGSSVAKHMIPIILGPLPCSPFETECDEDRFGGMLDIGFKEPVPIRENLVDFLRFDAPRWYNVEFPGRTPF